ncbi:MAG TPA: TRAP transporter large permease, partial [Bacillota bacterium]|nr:TRAP transporter large permease [Bacillota bacterium]
VSRMTGTLMSLLFLILGFGFPIFMALIVPSIITLISYFPSIDPMVVPQRMVTGIDKFSLMAIPFFMYCADVMSEGEIGKKLINLTKTLVGHLPGGLSIATVLACLIFGAISGAGTAAVIAIGALVFKPLMENGYGEKFSLGVILSSSTLAMLIPPSIAYVLYATITGDSIAVLFMSGLEAGAIFGLAFMIYSYYYAKKNKVPLQPRATFREVIAAFKDAFWALGLPAVLLFGIYGGLFTPTEAAAVAAMYAIIVEMLIYKSIDFKKLIKVSINSGKTISMLMILIAAGSVLSWVMTAAQIPQQISAMMGGSSKLVVLLIINVIFLIAGMLIDTNSAIIVLTPLIYPAAMMVGIDSVHLATIIVANLAIGMLTPPFGMNLFVATAVFKTPYDRVIPGVIPFIVISILVLLLVTYIPATTLLLPRVLLGY